MITAYMERDGIDFPDAAGKASEPIGERATRIILDSPPDQIHWHQLSSLTATEPEKAHAVWESVKSQAADELASGQRAAAIADAWPSTPWDRAQFMVVRDAFRSEWEPRGGVEAALIDTLALACTGQLYWLSRHFAQVGFELQDEAAEQAQTHRAWQRPRLTDAEAMEQSAAMVDRFNRLLLRTLRALRDLRRYSSQVVVQNANQVNVGQQQVNVSGESRVSRAQKQSLDESG